MMSSEGADSIAQFRAGGSRRTHHDRRLSDRAAKLRTVPSLHGIGLAAMQRNRITAEWFDPNRQIAGRGHNGVAVDHRVEVLVQVDEILERRAGRSLDSIDDRELS